ncbi:MAG: ATP-binding protein, partial [Psychrosphaera sp.]|nr:ATP-binding protein [Psychrosphaera sp.]
DGELFFGGINGLNRFYPHNIIDDKTPPLVAFTDFLLFNQSVAIQNQRQIQPSIGSATEARQDHGAQQNQPQFSLPKAIGELTELTLDYQQTLVAFEFSALDYRNPQKNRYAYKLEGFDQYWIKADANIRRATYTNLPSGNYTLRVKASNADGYWNERGVSLDIVVLSAPWFSWWAWLFYALAVLGGLMLFIRGQLDKVQKEREVNLQLTQVNRLKDEFLANTSHELRTPLNGIIGLAESLMDGIGGEQSKLSNANLAMIVSSGKRLANLVNDILDFSKLKNRNLTLYRRPVDLCSMTEVVLALSKPLLEDKSLALVNDISNELPAVLADEDRLQQILHNLVGNAIKFTEAGRVTVSAALLDQHIKISVTDTGIGIASDQLDSIFESFEQVHGDGQRSYGGTGLGLAVSKQLVQLHGGQITVVSKLGHGSTFSITLEVADEPFEAGVCTKRAVARVHMLNHETILNHEAGLNEGIGPIPTSNLDTCQFKILLVDDEPVNRQVLHNHLSLQNYQLVEASGGQEALQLIEQQVPFDLVLLDIMIPRVSGYEVCAKLRERYPVHDLPVIFLTAKNQVADLVESFAVGANDYLSKPVSKHELLTRVETHLKLLDVNRNLERKVADRTAALEQKNREIMQTQQQLMHA